MRVVIIGAGEVGVNLARTLAGDHHDVTLIDNDAKRCAAVETELDALVIVGSGASPEVLREADVKGAGLLAAVTHIDEVNLIAAMGAKSVDPNILTVARVREDDFVLHEGDPDADETQKGPFGIDFVINPDYATSHDIAAAISLPGAVSVEYFGGGRLGLAEVIVGEQSALLGQTLAERSRAVPSYIVGWSRHGEATLARGEHTVEVGDHVIVAAAVENLPAAVVRMAGQAKVVNSCVIFGGGRIGLRLAQLLEPTSIKVTVLERDAERARMIAEKLRRTTVLNDEGLSSAALLSCGVGEADAFVASAGDDRANLLAALNAKQLGAGLTLAVVSREEFVPLVDALEIDAAFSPRMITAEGILRFVHTRALRALHMLRSGFEALELEADPGSEVVGLELGSTHGVLKGCRVGAILRGGEVVVPVVGTEIEAGDRVLMLGMTGTLANVERAFSAER